MKFMAINIVANWTLDEWNMHVDVVGTIDIFVRPLSLRLKRGPIDFVQSFIQVVQ